MLKTILELIKSLLGNFFKDKIKELTDKDKTNKKDNSIESVIEDIKSTNTLDNSINKCKINSSNTIKALQDLANNYNTEPTIINPNGEKTLLLLDDQAVVDIIYTMDIKEIETKHNKKIQEDFKIVKILLPMADICGIKYIDKNKIDYAYLDLTLGNVINTPNGIVEADGIDIAYFIKTLYPDCVITLLTAHNIVANASIVRDYKIKCKELLNVELEDIYLNKNSNRVEHIIKTLYKDT